MPLALTTTFTPAASCLSSTYYFFEDGSARVQLGPPSTSDCLPSSYQADPSFYYSPGVCPSGYTTACWSMTTNTQNSEQETVATCCPRNFACMTTVAHGWNFQSTLPCESHWPADGGTTTVTVTALISGITSLTARTVSSLDAVNNYGVIIRQRAAATTGTAEATTLTAPSLTPEPSASPSAGSAARTSSGAPAATATSASLPSSSSSSSSSQPATAGSSLSTGAKAGIGIGAAAAVLLLIAALALGFMIGRRRRRANGDVGYGQENAPGIFEAKAGWQKPIGYVEFGNHDGRTERERAELPGVRDTIFELQGDRVRGV